MRIPLRGAMVFLLLAVGLWPAALASLYALDPLLAVRTQTAALWFGSRTLAVLGGASALLLLCYPPFPAAVRYGFVRLRERLRTDRGPLMRALSELRHFETAEKQLEAGRAAISAGDPKAALPHLQRAIELDRALLAAQHLLGMALLRLGHPAAARAPLTAVVTAAPDHAFGDSLLLLGRAHMLGHDHGTAAELLQRHARAHGGSRKSHYWLGRCLRAAGDERGAQAAFAVAAAPPAHGRLGAEDALFRARARVARWRPGRRP